MILLFFDSQTALLFLSLSPLKVLSPCFECPHIVTFLVIPIPITHVYIYLSPYFSPLHFLTHTALYLVSVNLNFSLLSSVRYLLLVLPFPIRFFKLTSTLYNFS